jgi:hypothetical protein
MQERPGLLKKEDTWLYRGQLMIRLSKCEELTTVKPVM